MKRIGEQIIITKTGETKAAKALAEKISRGHVYCSMWSIDPQRKVLRRDEYMHGKYVFYVRPAQGGCLFSDNETIVDAMIRHGEGWVKKNAARIKGIKVETPQGV